MPDVATSPLALCILVVVVAATSSLFPFSPVEPWLVGVAAVAPAALLPLLIALVTVSSMSAKTLVFLGGRRAEAAFTGRTRQRFERLRARVADRPNVQNGTLFLSSVVGFPPFYIVTALCGTVQMPLRRFIILATAGRAIRFAAIMLAPQLMLANADEPEPVSVVARRVVAPITVLVGALRTNAGPKDEEFRVPQGAGRTFHLDTVRGAGHFPHEEMPDQVAERIMRPPWVIAALRGQ